VFRYPLLWRSAGAIPPDSIFCDCAIEVGIMLAGFLAGEYSFSFYALPAGLCGILILSLGLLTLTKKIKSIVNLAFSLTCFSISIWLLSATMIYLSGNETTAFFWCRVLWADLVFIGSCIYFLTLAVSGHVKTRQTKLVVNFLISAFFCFLAIFTNDLIDGLWKYSWGYYPKASTFYYFFLLFFTGQMVVCLYNFYTAYKRSSDMKNKQRIRMVLIAFGIGYTASVDFLPNLGYGIYPFGYLPMLLFAGIIFYSIVKYKLWDISTVIHKTVMWAVMSSAVLIPTGAFFYFQYGWIQNLSPIQLGLLVWFVTLFLVPYISFIQPRIDHLFDRIKRGPNYQAILSHFSKDIARVLSIRDLCKRTVGAVQEVRDQDEVAIFLLKDRNFIKVYSEGQSETPKRINKQEFLNALGVSGVLMPWTISKSLFEKSYQEQWGKFLNASLVVPVSFEGELVAIISLRGESGYSKEELDVYATIAGQVSTAIKNSLQYEEIKDLNVNLEKKARNIRFNPA